MLYKYVAPERVDVLLSKHIRFTQPSALNDPFEMRPYFEALLNEEQMRSAIAEEPPDLTDSLRKSYWRLPLEDRKKVSFARFQRHMNELLQTTEGKRIFETSINKSFEVMKAVTPKIRAQLEDGLTNRIGILSLSEVPDGVLMWAHYAAKHSGFVIGFDERHPFFNRKRSESDEFFHLRKVVYRAPTKFAALTDMTGDDLMLSKSPHWEYERECRMLAPITSANVVVPNVAGDIYLFDFPPDCIRRVVLGARCAPSVRSHIEDIVSAPEYRFVELMQARLDPKSASVLVESK